MLPIDPTQKNIPLVNGIPVYSFQDPNSADFTYNYNINDLGQNTILKPFGIGYYGTNNIAIPNFICNPINQNNAFSGNFPNWLSTINAQIDLRGFYVKCGGGPTPLSPLADYFYIPLVPTQP